MCNGIRFFSIRITSYPLKKQILTTADLASSTCNKTQQYLSISSYPNRKKSIQHFLLSLSEYCPNSFWKQSSVHRFLRKQGRDAHRRCCRPYDPSNSPRDHWIARTSTVRRIPSTPKTTKTTYRF